ncbi:MAG: pro-sigmaK processing inhibitor BofA family protein [Oscillospiraceae bacterium]
MSSEVLIGTVLAVSFLIIGLYLKANKYLIKGIFTMPVSGGLSLLIVNLLSGFLGISVPINIYSLLVSFVLGIPGVIGIVTMKLICGL